MVKLALFHSWIFTYRFHSQLVKLMDLLVHWISVLSPQLGSSSKKTPFDVHERGFPFGDSYSLTGNGEPSMTIALAITNITSDLR
jgi:hypothetical protein